MSRTQNRSLYEPDFERRSYGDYRTRPTTRRDLSRMQKIVRKGMLALLAIGAAAGVGVAAKAGAFDSKPETAPQYSADEEARLGTTIAPMMRKIDREVLGIEAQHPGTFAKLTPKHPGEVRLVYMRSKDSGKPTSRMVMVEVVMGTNADGTPNAEDPRYVEVQDNTNPSGPGRTVDSTRQLIAPGGEDYADGLTLSRQFGHDGSWGGWSAASSNVFATDGQVDIYMGGTIDTSDKDHFVADPDNLFAPTDMYKTAESVVTSTSTMVDGIGGVRQFIEADAAAHEQALNK
ncbi:MAG TPA: hypothetical protein VLF40_04390 [Candidatus Saccharimonadales bacterium]|nr:hypothetical protein [Candidatus Saccharimonadales bacterium]